MPRASRRQAPEPKGVAETRAAALRLRHALEALASSGTLAGVRSKRISTRIDPGLMEAARRRLGLATDTEVINAALAIAAAGDDFGAWLVSQAGRLPEDFELAI